jgi:hypothetical protein
MRVDTRIHAGNALLEAGTGDTIRFRPDVRDTTEPWFYWNLRVRGEHNEHIYIVGSEDPANALRQLDFAASLESVRRGSLPYRAAGTLPFGQAWNVGPANPAWVGFTRWMVAHAPGQPTVATFELPYADAEGVAVTAASARAFGHDLARAIAASV